MGERRGGERERKHLTNLKRENKSNSNIRRNDNQLEYMHFQVLSDDKKKTFESIQEQQPTIGLFEFASLNHITDFIEKLTSPPQ